MYDELLCRLSENVTCVSEIILWLSFRLVFQQQEKEKLQPVQSPATVPSNVQRELQREKTYEREIQSQNIEIDQVQHAYKAGSISEHLENWRSISNNNSYILDIVKNGYRL